MYMHVDMSYCTHTCAYTHSLSLSLSLCLSLSLPPSECDFVVHRKCEQKVVIDCSSRLESDLLSHDKQVEDVERIAAEEGEDVCACMQFGYPLIDYSTCMHI